MCFLNSHPLPLDALCAIVCCTLFGPFREGGGWGPSVSAVGGASGIGACVSLLAAAGQESGTVRANGGRPSVAAAARLCAAVVGVVPVVLTHPCKSAAAVRSQRSTSCALPIGRRTQVFFRRGEHYGFGDPVVPFFFRCAVLFLFVRCHQRLFGAIFLH